MEEKQYPRLRTRMVLVAKDDPEDIQLSIDVPHLIIGLICPEVSQSVEDTLNRLNLMPYELAARLFAGSDFLYDTKAINSAGKRTIKYLTDVAADSPSAATQCPVVITYLEFQL